MIKQRAFNTDFLLSKATTVWSVKQQKFISRSSQVKDESQSSPRKWKKTQLHIRGTNIKNRKATIANGKLHLHEGYVNLEPRSARFKRHEKLDLSTCYERVGRIRPAKAWVR